MFQHNPVIAVLIAVVGIVFYNALVILAVSVHIFFEGMVVGESVFENTVVI